VAYAPPFNDTSHRQEYVGVPVDGIVPVSVNAWLASSTVALAVGAAGAVRTEFTVTAFHAEDAEAEALSVTT